MASTSLYATIKLARLVQKVKDCFKSRIKKCRSSTKPPKSPDSTKLTAYTCKTINSTIKSQSTTDCHTGRCRTLLQAQRRNADLSSLLSDLDIYARCGNLSLCNVAAQDWLLLDQTFQLPAAFKNLDSSYQVFDLTSALLDRLQRLSGNDTVSHSSKNLQSGDLKCEKFIANLEHLLRCLKQLALDSIIQHYLNLVKSHVLHWHDHWQHQKRIDEGWFAEWPNGQRPLSTTWPWNVKPSLLVLWGVCWMFYGFSGYQESNSRATRNQGGAAQQPDLPELSGDFRTRHFASVSLPNTQALPTSHPSENWGNVTPNTYPNYSWLHPQQAGATTRRANDSSNTILPTYQASLPADPYIITSTSHGSSDLFATSTEQWPYCQGINQDPSPAYAPNFTPWRSVYDTTDNITGDLTATPQHLDTQTPVQSHGVQQRQATNPQAAVGSVGSLGFGLGLGLQNMQDYPSPHSNVSEQTTSSCVSILPGAVISPSPRMPAVSSPNPSVAPSVGGSSNSRHSSRRSTEPPRNAQGVFYCAHPEHGQNPPVFSRKCEWTKHMDKHNRPYVCDEPECDNIRGFTYSGGLLRHQREVHRQHGGPKASCMCPYKDCKRSTGVGFSRKENLNEHLRRCHQPQRTEAESQVKNEESTSRSRKRRRVDDQAEEREVSDERSTDEGLKKEVKKLRRELAEKDERLRRLEENMERLVRGNR